MTNQPDDTEFHCHLCGTPTPGAAPWVLWCPSCCADGLNHSRIAIWAGVALAGIGGVLAASPLQAALVAAFVVALTLASLVDFNIQLLPDDVTGPLLWAGLLANAYGVFSPLQPALMGAAVGYGSLWCLYWLVFMATKQEAFGYGDLKLTAALGAWLGLGALPGILIGAATLQALVGICLKSSSRSPGALPFGPALAAAGMAAMAYRLLAAA